MGYNKVIKKINRNGFALCSIFLVLISCYDSGFDEFVPPSGNINNIQPNTLFTTSTVANDYLSIVFRSYSTDADTYLWDFGDGNTSTEENPNYTYTVGGLYTVTLTTTSSDGLTTEASEQVSPVFVDFNHTSVDTQVTFENLSSGASQLVWDFGDGETLEWGFNEENNDSNLNPTYTYTTEDSFEVTLTATNFLGVQTSITKNIEGLVLSTIPDFTFTTSSLTAQFTDASILAVSHSWDFGDGNMSTEINPLYTYDAAGTYNVTLTTTNNAGISREITKAVPVGGIEATFKAIVLNGTCNDHTSNTGDNADAWDMTPNSTVVDDILGTIDSPYRAIWNNSDLNG